ncbi:hypothetical protein MRB53_009465 [Persea americana]|uniref:Uncharacterized protein n=1 Tax=Persea americana TaxID=3435 RepID=A0ACC2LP61_PERAE|nr:hypothetical protein MRB53_009465 [Persea americana]
MALTVGRDKAIEYIVQEALDEVKSRLNSGVDLFREQSPKKDRKLKKLLEKLKVAAVDAEELLKVYAIEDQRRSEGAANSMPVRNAMMNKVHKVVTYLSTAARALINRVRMPIKLKRLSERLEAIKAECHTFQLKEKVTNLDD